MGPCVSSRMGPHGISQHLLAQRRRFYRASRCRSAITSQSSALLRAAASIFQVVHHAKFCEEQLRTNDAGFDAGHAMERLTATLVTLFVTYCTLTAKEFGNVSLPTALPVLVDVISADGVDTTLPAIGRLFYAAGKWVVTLLTPVFGAKRVLVAATAYVIPNTSCTSIRLADRPRLDATAAGVVAS